MGINETSSDLKQDEQVLDTVFFFLPSVLISNDTFKYIYILMPICKSQITRVRGRINIY